MTDKVNPSVNRPAEAYTTAGAIAFGGHGGDGFIIDGGSPTGIATQDGDIDEGNLNSFEQSSSSSSLNMTIDAGEAFVFGAWTCIDVSTVVTLEPNTSNQTVFVGWNKNTSNDVIVGVESSFALGAADADEKIPLYDFDTDGSGVTNVTDRRRFEQITASQIEQGPGSTLDADSVDGAELADLSTAFTHVRTETTSYTSLDGDIVLADATSGPLTITLPPPSSGNIVTVKKIDNSVNDVTISTPTSETIDGQSSLNLTSQNSTQTIVSDGTDYYII
jgi:hypothetical protein